MSDFKVTKEYRVNDVYLARYGFGAELMTICEICGNMVRHKYSWESIEVFNARVVAKYGRRRKFLKLFWITKRD